MHQPRIRRKFESFKLKESNKRTKLIALEDAKNRVEGMLEGLESFKVCAWSNNTLQSWPDDLHAAFDVLLMKTDALRRNIGLEEKE